MEFIFERLLLEYNKETEQQFFDIFANGDEKVGRELLDTFDKSKQLLLNNNISNDIQKWISDAKRNPDKVDELKNILHNLGTRQNRIDKSMDIRQKRVPGKYKILWQGDGTTLYRIDDVIASMALGVNTGWCTTGRYRHYGDPNFVPSREDAEKHFNDHQNLPHRGIGKLYYLVDDDTGYGLEAWHFQENRDGKYKGYTKFDDEDNIVEDSDHDPTDKLGIIAYDDFMEYAENIIENMPEFEIKDGTLVRYNGRGGDVVIPNSVTYIGGLAFEGCKWLTNVKIPDSVTSIGNAAFLDCTSLTGVVIPDSVTSIGNHAFFRCGSLTDITIPDSVIYIGEYAFSECSGLISAKMDNCVASIERGMFWGCTNLKSVTIPGSVEYISATMFNSCYSLTDVKIGNGVTSIGKEAFTYCTGLKSITIPGSVKTIGDFVFSNCDRLTAIKIENGVTSIGNCAFYKCTNLTSVTIPNSVTSIGHRAFFKCDSLTRVRIGDGLTSIGKGIFEGCYSLRDIYYGGTEENWLENRTGSQLSLPPIANIHFNSAIEESFCNDNRVRFIAESDRTPGLEHSRDFNGVYNTVKRKSRKKKGISMLQGSWGGNPKFIPNPAGGIRYFNMMMTGDTGETDGSSSAEASSSVDAGGSSGGMGESIRRRNNMKRYRLVEDVNNDFEQDMELILKKIKAILNEVADLDDELADMDDKYYSKLNSKNEDTLNDLGGRIHDIYGELSRAKNIAFRGSGR